MIKVDKYLANIEKTADYGYWLGTYGQIATDKLWNSKRAQYPKWYLDPAHADEKARWLGRPVLDCIGVDKYARWLKADGTLDYDVTTDKNADGMFAYAKAQGMKWGTMDTMPMVPGIALTKPGHWGVLLKIVDGVAISRESQCGDWGVEDHPVKDRPWVNWYYNPYVDYSSVAAPAPVPEPSTPSAAGTVVFVVTCKLLNTRIGPSGDYKLSGAPLPTGTELNVVAYRGAWGQHQFGWSNIGPAFCMPKGAAATPAREDYTSYPKLRKGDIGKYVIRMQVGLIAKGFSIPDGATGGFYAQTETAALAFLKTVGLVSRGATTMNGVTWGPLCWKALLG